jgi:DNA-3-methyladenine glycosylase II
VHSTSKQAQSAFARALSHLTVAGAAVRHLSSDGCGLKDLVAAHGQPTFYADKCKDLSDLSNFQSLAKAIVFQQLAGAAASTIWGRLLALAAEGQQSQGFGACASDAGTRAGDAAKRQSDGWKAAELMFLTPARCQELGEERMRTAGLSKQKASYVLDLAKAFSAGGMERLTDMPDAELTSKLLAIRGVGPWTVDMFAIFTLHRSDILPTGDLGVRKGMQAHFGLKDLPTPSKMEHLAEPWRPYRSLASWYMWQRAGTTLPASATSKT